MKLQRTNTKQKLARSRVVTQLARTPQLPKRVTRSNAQLKLGRALALNTTPTLLYDSDLTSIIMYDRVGSVNPTISGPTRYFPSQGARVNLIRNPRFATNTTGWGALSTGTISRVLDSRFSYGTAAEIYSISTSTGGAMSSTLSQSAVIRLGSGTHTVAFDAVLVTGTALWSVWCSHRNAAGTLISESSINFTVTDKVQRFAFTFTPAAGSYTTIFRFTSQGSVGVVRVSNMVFELGSHVNDPYFENNWLDPLTGYTGSANASANVDYAGNFIASATTNLITNPSFETNTTGWTAQNGSTQARVTTNALFGTAALQIIGNGSGARQGTMLTSGVTASASMSYTFSGYYCGPIEQFEIGWNNQFSAGIQVVWTPSISNEWVRFSVTLTTSSDTTSIRPYIRTSNTSANTWYVDGLQLEQKGHATSYCDGSLGSGHTWTGAANASSSTRTSTIVRAPALNHISATKGAVCCWYYINNDHNDIIYVLSITDASVVTNQLGVIVQNGSRDVQARWFDGINTYNTTLAGVGTAGVWHFVYVEWDGANVGISQDNGALTTSSRGNGSFTFDPTATVNFGYHRSLGIGHIDGLISQLYTFERPLTAGERSTLYTNRGGPFPFNQPQKLQRVKGV